MSASANAKTRSPGQRQDTGKTPGKGPTIGNPNLVNRPLPLQNDEAPQWARALMASVEQISSRVGLIESGAMRPSFSEAASDGGGVPVNTQSVVQTPRVILPAMNIVSSGRASSAAAPKMGESGSGYTLLPNGKMVRNKRPAHKPLNLRQATNWRSKATTELVTFLKQEGVGKDDPKPVNNPSYKTLVLELANAKEFYSYVKHGGTEEVQDWKNQTPPITWELYTANLQVEDIPIEGTATDGTPDYGSGVMVGGPLDPVA